MLKRLWVMIKEKNYKWKEREVFLSDGFKLKDLLHECLKEEISRFFRWYPFFTNLFSMEF